MLANKIQTSSNWTHAILVLAVSLVLTHWVVDAVLPQNLLWQIKHPLSIGVFETRFLYLFLHLFAFIPVFLLSFDKKVAFYKSWRHLFPALLISSALFWVWDMAKTGFQVWGFNPKYYTFLLLNLPIEEWLFFLTFPFCSVFIYECLNAYFPSDPLARFDRPLSILFAACFLIVGLLNWGRSYTATTWIPAGLFALWHFLSFKNTYRTQFYRAFFVGLVPFFLVNSVLTGVATVEPVVIYNPEEYLGVRIVTVPLDDFVYNFLLQFIIISLFEGFRRRKTELSVSVGS